MAVRHNKEPSQICIKHIYVFILPQLCSLSRFGIEKGARQICDDFSKVR